MYLLQRCGFCLATQLYWPDWWVAVEILVLLEGSLLSREECLSSNRMTIGLMVTFLTKALLLQSLNLDGWPDLRTHPHPGASPGVSARRQVPDGQGSCQEALVELSPKERRAGCYGCSQRQVPRCTKPQSWNLAHLSPTAWALPSVGQEGHVPSSLDEE